MRHPPRRVLLDAGVFIGGARGRRTPFDLLRESRRTARILIAAHTIAEFFRGGAASARESQLLAMWAPEIVPIQAREARCAGVLLARTGGANTMDALVVAAALIHGIDHIFTSDPDDLRRLVRARDPGAGPVSVIGLG